MPSKKEGKLPLQTASSLKIIPRQSFLLSPSPPRISSSHRCILSLVKFLRYVKAFLSFKEAREAREARPLMSSTML